jgi:hypothetical protein
MCYLKATKYGDWTVVEKNVYHKRLLKKAHLTSCTKKDAEKLLKYLSLKYFGKESFLLMTWPIHGKFNWGGIKKIHGIERPYVSLDPMSRNKAKVLHMKSFGLRIGIVLHEFCHSLSYLTYKNGGGHGKMFARVLDLILDEEKWMFN